MFQSRFQIHSAHVIAFALIVLLSCNAEPANSQDTEAAASPALTLVRFGETKPAGWMLGQMRADLDDGLAGHYTEISDTVNQREFVTRTADQPDASGNPGWWFGEHEGYYADGLFRLAWLSARQSVTLAAIARLEDALAAQDNAGYIGVYPLDYRLGAQDPNDGELWTQSRMFQAMLAWYEATGDQRILTAVDKAAKLTLAAYEYRSYFDHPGFAGGGGVSHGVAFSDTLEWLYRLTGDDTYRSGYLWLYADYSNSNVRDNDLTPPYLSDATRPWYSHTPHIAEALAMPAIAAAYGGPGEYAQAADQVLGKLRRYSNPGGGPVGDEAVAGRSGSFELTSEYCSMTETIASLNRLAQFRDAMETGDIAERIALNGAQGARLHPAATAISYLTADNRLSATQTAMYGDRLLYSASHLTAACCSLNSTRLLPYYVEGMWLKETGGAGLVARLYGASMLDTTIGGTPVHVVEETDFPFSDKVLFTISPDAPLEFRLTLRIPDYAQGANVIAPAGMNITRGTDRFEITGAWKSGDTVSVDLAFTVHRVQDSNGESAMAYGPLLYALPIGAVAIPSRITRAQGTTSTLQFQDTEYLPSADPPKYLLPRDLDFQPVPLPDADMFDPWSKPPTGLSGSLLAPDGSRVNVTLRPLGTTLLRVTGFTDDEIFGDGFGSQGLDPGTVVL
ncbi:MAG TPA: beta-L-arabinofuranosidase domain-containing protein [Rudaea sp.]